MQITNSFPARILLASDSSEGASPAVRAAVDISNRTGSELHVAHAWQVQIPPARTPYPLPVRHSSCYEREAGDLLTAQVKWIEEAGGTVTKAHLIEGSPVDAILDLSEELEIGLIIVGSRGLNPLKSFVMGSVSESLVRHASRPILVVRGGEQSWPPVRVVVGQDLSENARQAAQLAAHLGELFGAEGLLVLAYPELPEIPGGNEDPEVRNDKELRRAEAALEALSVELESELRWRPRTEVVLGDAAAVVLAAAEERHDPTLIVMGSRDLGRLGRLRLGSVSEKVLLAASGPVLICPRSAGQPLVRGRLTRDPIRSIQHFFR